MLRTPRKTTLAAIAASAMTLTGCASWWQKTGTVLERTPASDGYLPEKPASETAAQHLLYAVLSAGVYERTHSVPAGTTQLSELGNLPCQNVKWPIQPPNWNRWWNFPDDSLRNSLHEANMHVEVWETEGDDPRIVIVFEGTVFTSADHWKANLRWFLRFFPKTEDQYTVASKAVASAFHKALTQSPSRYRYSPNEGALTLHNGKRVRIIATGHSLGGGLAQQFAYAFPQEANPPAGPKVDEVFAFDTSPVTGWYSTPNPPRDYNATGLRVNRIFEHGEILAYVRLFTSNLAARTDNPKFWIYRYNFAKSADLLGSHSMATLSCELARATAGRQPF